MFSPKNLKKIKSILPEWSSVWKFFWSWHREVVNSVWKPWGYFKSGIISALLSNWTVLVTYLYCSLSVCLSLSFLGLLVNQLASTYSRATPILLLLLHTYHSLCKSCHGSLGSWVSMWDGQPTVKFRPTYPINESENEQDLRIRGTAMWRMGEYHWCVRRPAGSGRVCKHVLSTILSLWSTHTGNDQCQQLFTGHSCAISLPCLFSASACQKVSPGNITKQLEVPLPLWRSSRVELKQGIIFFLGIGWRSIELETCITTLLPVFKSGLRAGLKEHLWDPMMSKEVFLKRC